jgi:DNA repair exonuclease SbcCD nuclease subunit
MPTFLHTADWQMGRTFSRFETEDGAALVEARFEAIETLARLANEHQCDAVLVAGDVFDAQTVPTGLFAACSTPPERSLAPG